MFGGFSGTNINDGGYAVSPGNTARSRGKQVRTNDGFHSAPVRDDPGGSWRRKAAIGLAALACCIAAILVLRATGDRDERIQEPAGCVDLYTAEVCEVFEPSD